jgi:hypothetical protein
MLVKHQTRNVIRRRNSEESIIIVLAPLSATDGQVAEQKSSTNSDAQDDSFLLYRCRCREAKVDSEIACFTHSLASKLPISPH